MAHAADLLSVAQGHWQTTLATLPWLEASWHEQLVTLHQALAHSQEWQESLAVLGLQDVLTIDFLTYIEQQLSRQQQEPAPASTPAAWLPQTSEAEWRLALPDPAPPHLLYHLWQMGNFGKDGSWQGVAPLPNYEPPIFDLGANKSADGVIEYAADAFCALTLV